MQKKKYIAVVGSINADLVTRSERFPACGETLRAESFHVFPGGKGANQAVAIARLGQAVEFFGCIGSDVFAPMLRESLNRAGVCTSAMETGEGASGIATITTLLGGENHILLVPGANHRVTPEYVKRHHDRLRDAAMILTQLETPLETLEHLAAFAESEGIPLMLDPAPAQELSPSLTRKVSWLTPNQTEASLLTQSPSGRKKIEAAELLEKLRASGAKNVLLKLGSDGVCAATTDGELHCLPAFPVRAVDTTAAGDAFNGGLATAIVQGQDTLSALRFASAVAALSVTRPGAQPSMPSREEVDVFLAEQPDEGFR